MNYLPGAVDLDLYEDHDNFTAAPARADTDNVLWFQHSVSLNSRTV